MGPNLAPMANEPALQTEVTRRFLVRTVLYLVVIGAILFGAAGTLHWPEAWIYLALSAALSFGGGLWLARHDPGLLAERLGIPAEAGIPAAEVGLLEVGARVRFRHPLARSAVHRSALPDDLREVHHALSLATDPVQDPDRRAWHAAKACSGPDEEVASALESSAERARLRGGMAAEAALLEQAARSTPDPRRRGRRALAAGEAYVAAASPDSASELAGVFGVWNKYNFRPDYQFLIDISSAPGAASEYRLQGINPRDILAAYQAEILVAGERRNRELRVGDEHAVGDLSHPERSFAAGSALARSATSPSAIQATDSPG